MGDPMVRKQVYIEAAQEQFLKRRAKELGVTEADLSRRAIDTLVRTPAGPPFDPEAWTTIVELMEQQARLPIGGDRMWTRDDLYEERLGRVCR